MRKLIAIGVLLALVPVVVLAFPPPRPAGGPGAIEDLLRGFFKAMDAGDRAAARACLVEKASNFPVLVYDLDLQNKPVAIDGLEGATKYLDSIFDALERDSVKVESKITGIHADCHSPELGYATLEFSQTFTAGGKRETYDYRATALVSWGEDQAKGPKLFHWHGSLAKEPAKAQAGTHEKQK